jgi:D-aminopeptidase
MNTTDTPRIGTLPAGPLDAISDVAGVTVGHCTLAQGEQQTGVTVIRPHAADPFRAKPRAAAVVLNGFGKSVGLMQVAELGVLETPIALTNTFAVGAIAQAQIAGACRANPEIGRGTTTVNPLVLECNDGYLNDIQAMSVGAGHYEAALATAEAQFAQGSVGAGRGMSMFGVKGGIGSASRMPSTGRERHAVGALVLANFGRAPDLILDGRRLGGALRKRLANMPAAPESGSIIIVLATDAPLDDRQLRRLALRAGAGLARTGSVFGHGSGDIVIAFSTANPVPHDATAAMPACVLLHDARLDPLFQAAADATEQAIVHALFRAQPVRGFRGHERRAFLEVFPDWHRRPGGSEPCEC